jgi:hypothetical protein
MKAFTSLVVLGGVLVAGLAMGSGADAGTIVVAQGPYESRGGYRDGEFYITPTGVPGLRDGVRIGSFCMEMTEGISVGATYNAVLNTVAIKGSAPVSDPLGPKTAWLYDQFRTGAIVLDTGAKATDFQYAIWKLEDEDTQAPAAWATITWTPEAEVYYQMALASTWTDIHNVRVLNLTTLDGRPAQDLIVPEPATMALLAFGCAVMLVRRRRK